ncbi:lysosomal-trafficking regulator-like isoform X2 [Saccostrea echinata]|uniref:lysosomal-trafficking regulator-like isoform X2 n=1 Tax=Saccostrea echinata TaxID=191078 RepID=UPI002A7EE8E7|nr:lysosomal-trafficking regulator-like isoform X2 [Saccostrea echinata]
MEDLKREEERVTRSIRDGVHSEEGHLTVRDAWTIYRQISFQEQTDQNQHLQNLSLNAFLHLFLKEADNNVGIQGVGDMRCVANHLCQEFMSDIISVTGSSEDEDDTPLQNYLLRERGWLLLYTIHRNGTQGLTVGKDFSNLLVSLLPWCLKFPVDNPNSQADELESLLPINTCFLHLEHSSKWQRCSSQRNKVLPLTDKHKSKSRSSGGPKKHRKIPESIKRLQERSDSEAESVTEPVRKQRSGRRFVRHRSISQSLGKEPIERSQSSKEEDEEEMTTLLSKYNNGYKSISPYKLCMLILNVLSDVCLLDIDQSNPSKTLSPVLLPHLLHTLTNLYPSLNGGNEDLLAFHWLKRQQTYFQRKILRLILVMASIVATQPNGINIIVGHKLVSVLLDVARQIQQLQNLKEQLSYGKQKTSDDLSQITDDFVLFTELILGLLMAIDVTFQCLPFNLVHVKSAIQLVEEFDEGHGFILLENIIQMLDSNTVKATSIQMKLGIHVTEPVKIAASFLSTLKSLKLNYIHTMKCTKRKHKSCQFQQYFNHHHNILGLPHSSKVDEKLEGMPESSLDNTTCLIAVWCLFLLDLLSKVKDISLQVEILRTVEQTGNCCCVSLETIFEPIRKSLLLFSVGIQNFAMEVFNRILLEHFSRKNKNNSENLLELTNFQCNTCRDVKLVSVENVETSEKAVSFALDSGFSSHDFPDKKPEMPNGSKKVMQGFKDLLFSSEGRVAEVTAKNLGTLAQLGSESLKKDLFFNVYVHAFESFLVNVSKNSSSMSSEMQEDETCHLEFSSKVKVHCLLAVPNLLKVDSVMKAFLTKRGVGQICKMLDDNVLRAPVLKVFEALVILDEVKQREFENSLEAGEESKSKAGMVISAFIDGLAKKTDMSLSLYLSNEIKCEKDLCKIGPDNKYVQNLTVMVDMWETCAKICLNSEHFVMHLLESQCLPIAGNLLLKVLKQLKSSVGCTLAQQRGQGEEQSKDSSEDSGQELEQLVSLTMSMPSVCFLKLALLQSLLTVCNVCYKHHGRQDEIRMWGRIREAFQDCAVLPASRLKTLFDIMLISAMPKKVTVFDSNQKSSIPQDFIKDDDIDDDEIRQLLHASSEDDGDSVWVIEKGYDGDTETSHDDVKKWGSDSPSRREYFPSLFRLMVELLINCQRHQAGRDILPQVLLKLLQTLKGNSAAVMVICEEGLLYKLLTGFWTQLTAEDDKGMVRTYLLSLIQCLAQHRITSLELQKILQLFQHSHISRNFLLSCLLTIVEQSSVQPHYSIKFPVKSSPRKSSSTSSSVSSGSIKQSTELPAPKIKSTEKGSAVIPLLRSLSTMVTMMPTNDLKIQQEPENSQKAFEQEVWNVMAVEIPVGIGVTWPPYQSGLTFALWLKICEEEGMTLKPTTVLSTGNHVYASSSEDLTQKGVINGKSVKPLVMSECIHVMSVGTREKLLEVWICCKTGKLLFRLTSETNEDGLVLDEATSRDWVHPGKWHHIMFSYIEALENTDNVDPNLVGRLTLTIDGWQRQEIRLEQPNPSVKVDTLEGKGRLCVGHVYEELREMTNFLPWQMGSLSVFRGVDISEEECLYLYALGPSCRNVSKCDGPEQPISYSTFISKQLIQHANISHDTLVGLRLVDRDQLRMKIMLHYSGGNPDQVLLYESALRSEIPALMAGNLGIPQPQSLLLCQQPLPTGVMTHGKVATKLCYGLEKAVKEVGGMEAIMYLVAKTVEDNTYDNHENDQSEECIQSKALQLLFSVVNFSPDLDNDYMTANGNKLLSKVLTTSRGILGYTTLKVLFDASTTESIFRFDTDTGNLVMRRKNEAVVTRATVIEELILNWRIWEGAEEGVLDLLFRGLASLIREDHSHQAFNIKQFHSVSVVDKIFNIYQERIQDGCPAYPVSIGQSVVSIITSMMGSPPDMHIIVSVCDFLLFVHPAANTYISCSQSGFYFKLWWDSGKDQTMRSSMSKVNTVRTPSTSTPHTKASEESDHNFTEVDFVKKNLFKEDDTVFRDEAYPPVKVLHHKQGSWMEIITPEEFKTNQDDDGTLPKSLDPPIFSDDPKAAAEINAQDSGELNKQGHSPGTGRTKDQLKDGNQSASDAVVIDSEHLETVSDLEGSSGSTFHSSHLPTPTDLDNETYTQFENPFTKSVSSYTSEEIHHDDEGLIVQKPDVNFDEKAEDNDFERGLIAVCIGLLKTLSNVVINMPDTMVTKVLQNVINTDILIIMAHSNSPEVRTCVIKLLSSYLFRAPPEQVSDFLKKESFHLLGAQFYQYPSHTQQLEESISLILGLRFTFDSDLEINKLEMTPVQQSAVVLLLSLLENTLWDVALCHNALITTKKMFESSSVLGSLMLEAGLIEVLTNMLARIHRLSSRSTDIAGRDEHQICVEDLQNLVCVIACREFSASGGHHLQQFDDLRYLLRQLETKEKAVFGENSQVLQNLKSLQYSVILFQLNVVENAGQEKVFRQVSVPESLTESPGYAFGPIFPTFTNRPENLTESLPRLSALPLSFTSSVDIDNRSSYHGDSDSSASSGRLSRHQSLVSSLPSDAPQPKPSKSSFSIANMFNKFSSRKSRLMVLPLSQSEVNERFKKLLTSAVDMIVHTDKEEVSKPAERKSLSSLFEGSEPVSVDTIYMRRLFDFLYRGFEHTLYNQDRMLLRTQKNQVMWGLRDTTRIQLARLLVYMLSTRQILEDRTYILSYIVNEIKGLEILKILINTSTEYAHELGYYMWDLLENWGDSLNSQHRSDGSRILQILKNCDIPVVSPGKGEECQSFLTEEKLIIEMRLQKGRQLWKKKSEVNVDKAIHRQDKVYSSLSTLAMEMTQRVTKLQGQERSKFVEHIKRTMTEKIQIKKSWQQIVQNLTHERAVWHDAKSYPRSWQLDPTEGPSRVRKRLKRCHLGIEKKFITPENQYKIESEMVDPPLIYLFEDDHQTSDSAALIYQLYRSEKIQHTCKCTAVSPFNESKGELLVGENSIFFVADEAISDANYTQVLLGNKDQLSMTWPYEDIREIHRRWFQLRDVGIEIFLTNGKTCLLACQNNKEREGLYQHLHTLELPNYVILEELPKVQQSWIEGRMTNFDYLTHLNKIAGRSFNDLMQYPIFPFVLKDYFSERLNLCDEKSFRNLSKPMSVQFEEKKQKYIDNYNILKQERDRGEGTDNSLLRVEPYHYGSHYSNSGTVLHFLVRLPPFTKMFLSYQDKNFDLPDRTFHSVQTAWRLASFESATDVKELIPEFFFLPEFLKNSEGFDFGKRQNGEVVNDVNLAPWCNNDARLFVMILRQALESDYVTKNLHNWIDLVFGYKQQGEEAVKAINVFHPSTYFGMDIDSVTDPLRRHALKTMVKTYGQTPKQLFKWPHPQRNSQQDTPNIISQLFSTTSYLAEPSPLASVNGMKWGVYVGSRNLAPPEIIWQGRYNAVVASLTAFPTGEVFGVGEKCHCLTMLSKQKVSTIYNSTDVIWAAILDWKEADGILRIRQVKKENPPINLLSHSPFEQVTCCASVPDCRLLFVGGTSGTITIYNTVFNQAKESCLQIKGSRQVLHGHTGSINALVVCKLYSVVVSGSEDHTCIIWDLNRLCYVRSITSHLSPVRVVAISSTLGDIASVSQKGPGSQLMLHSINATPIAKSTTLESCINCLCFSTAPEGQSVNILAGGMDNGIIRLWSSMDLTVLRDLQTENLLHKPVISLTFTNDSSRLYMTSSDGTITVWESPPFGRIRPNNLLLHI